MKNHLYAGLFLFFSTSVISSICSAQQDTILPEAPLVASQFFGANRRVITGIGYTAVRGKFSIPTIRVPGAYNPSIANSKPTFYLGTSQNTDDDPMCSGTGSQADCGLQWEWEAFPFWDGAKFVTSHPGWSPFLNIDLGGGLKSPLVQEITAAGSSGWRCGPDTKNPGVTEFDLEWVIERDLPGRHFGYLKINALGAKNQPTGGAPGIDSPGKIYATDGGVRIDFGPGTACMRAKRVVGITQGGSYGRNRFIGGPKVAAVLRFPLGSADKIYDEDGSYMEGCHFSGVTGQSAGQVCFGDTRQNSTPSWQNWSTSEMDINSPSVEFTAERRTGFYPGGKDRQWLTPSPYLASIAGPLSGITNAPGAQEHFDFHFNGTGTSDRYDDESVSIYLRSATPTDGNLVSVGGSSYDSEDGTGS